MSYVGVHDTSISVHYWLQKAFKMQFERAVYLTNSLFISVPMGPSQKGLFEVQIVIKQIEKHTIWSNHRLKDWNVQNLICHLFIIQ